MKKFWMHFSAAVLATLFLSANPARADFVAWTYNWTRTPLAIPADNPGTGGITLTSEPVNHALGTSDVVATNIRTFSSAPRTNPDTFTNKAYTLTLSLQDDASLTHATLTWTGAFSGSLSGFSSNLTNTFTSALTQTANLGGHKYTVTIGSYAPPGPPTDSNAGSISAHVGVDEVPTISPPPSENAPEPSSLILAGSGLSFLGAGAWRRFNRKKNAVAAAS